MGSAINIKKALKKEKFKRKRDISISIFIMLIMAYIVAVLTDSRILTGFDSYFSFFYVIVVDFLILINIIRILSEEKISFQIKGDRLRIDGGYIDSKYLVPLDKIVAVDVDTLKGSEFNVLIITKKAHRKKYKDFNDYYVKKNPQYREIYEQLLELYSDEEKFSCIDIRKSGSRKYYLLYILYKSAYNINFSKKAIEYIRKFVIEYNL